MKIEIFLCIPRAPVGAKKHEIYDRSVLSQLRWCELASDVTFGALWMPMGRFDNVRC